MEEAHSKDLARHIFTTGSARLALLRAAWTVAVGPELARRTEILAIEGSTLRVRVPDARWKSVLHKMQRDLVVRLRQIAGSLASLLPW